MYTSQLISLLQSFVDRYGDLELHAHTSPNKKSMKYEIVEDIQITRWMDKKTGKAAFFSIYLEKADSKIEDVEEN